MLRPSVTEVKILENYNLLLKFNNGEIKVFDVLPYIQGEWFSELKQLNYFSEVKINGFCIEWPNGQDISPDDLYFNSKSISE